MSNPNIFKEAAPFRWKKGQSGNPAGRPKTIRKAVKKIPKDAQLKIYGVLFHAITLENVSEAQKYLEREAQSADLGDYGFVLQIAIRALAGKQGWNALNDILDRLFGKPKQTQDLRHIGPAGGVQITVNDPAAAAGLQQALATGAAPEAPKDTEGEE